MSIWQFFTGTPVTWTSSHDTFAPLPLHLDMPRFSTTAFVHWTCRALLHDNGFLQVQKPRDGRSTPLFWRTGIRWSSIVVFKDSSWPLLHSITFIVWHMHVPFCFHGNSHKIHRFYIELQSTSQHIHHCPKYTLCRSETGLPPEAQAGYNTVRRLNMVQMGTLPYVYWSLVWYLRWWWNTQPSWTSLGNYSIRQQRDEAPT